ncbi:MAG: low-specificity L-threonine aldolase [Anaerolineaceae bacterium]|nr:low-specificity L-threonine aldolase [Anaerolineaceae bacterium]
MAFENGIIDFRSDTVTHPTPAMRKAMANAPVGDDVYGEDPTINTLEQKSADLMGKESGLFTASGTMANLIAVLTYCGRGDEVVMGNNGHTFLHEVGGISALGSVFPQLIPNQLDGTLALQDVKNAIREDDIHHPETRLFVLENTQNSCGGLPLSREYTNAVAEILKPQNILLHIDGARIFNASVALEVEPSALVEAADSVMFCLSKGLCAPVGSVLCGSNEFIRKARKIRKQLGGGMRQVGVLGAAGIVAIDEMIDRLGEDHLRAKNLAEGMKKLPGIIFDKGLPRSNMVYIELSEEVDISPENLVKGMAEAGILVGMSGPRNFRFVTHYWINDQDVEKFLARMRYLLNG